jgi:hypothetical protein
MPSDPEENDPLLRALAELRQEVNSLIDEQVAQVKERVQESNVSRPLRPAVVMNVAEPTEDVAKARALDPRQRLDALAKHLDHRLRLANVPVADRGEPDTTPEE